MRRWLGLLCVAAFLMAGCGSGEEADPAARARTDAAPIEPTAPVEGSQPSPDYAAQAKRIVRAYYRSLNTIEFEAAWGRLSPAMQVRLGPFETWRAGYDLTEGTQPVDVDVLSANRAGAELAVVLATDDLDVCGDHVRQQFEGTLGLGRGSGQWTIERIDFERVGGREPVRDETACRDWEPVEPPPDYEPPPDFTPIPDDAPGEPLYEPPPDFCDTHDCIPNFNEGTGYPVMCEDGTWSGSGGRPGACSWHDGVAP